MHTLQYSITYKLTKTVVYHDPKKGNGVGSCVALLKTSKPLMTKLSPAPDPYG